MELMGPTTRQKGEAWLLGAHGGAGVSSLRRAGVPARDAQGVWPDVDQPAQVVVVCRSSATGLAAARSLAREHARGLSPALVDLVGLVVVNDAPKLGRPLRGERVVISGAFEWHWYVPWLEEWRHSPAGPLPAPPVVRDLSAELRQLDGVGA
jgi:hypothetical protein